MMGLVAVSAVIAGVGLVTCSRSASCSGAASSACCARSDVSNGQVRRMVLLEAAHITIAATATGLVLGIVYGWAGAQSLLGSIPMNPTPLGRRSARVARGAVLAGRRDRGGDGRAHARRRGRADAARDPRRAGGGARRVARIGRSAGTASTRTRRADGRIESRRGISVARALPSPPHALGCVGSCLGARVVRPGRRQRADARCAPLPRRPQHGPQRERGRPADHEPVAPQRLGRDRRARARSPSGGPRRPGSPADR